MAVICFYSGVNGWRSEATSPLKNGLVAAHGRAADFAGLKNPVKSRGWPDLVLANRELKKPGRLFQQSAKVRSSGLHHLV